MGKQKTIMLLITYKCNLSCSYCYEPKEHHFHMDDEKVIHIILNQIAQIGDDYDSVEIQFMGGEPLLEFSLIKNVSEWLWKQSLGKKLMVLFAPTNGTLLTDRMKDWFTANKEKIHLGLSFDGDISMQNENRSQSYNQVDLDFFASTWPDQSVKMTISPETVNHLSEGVIHLHNKGFRFISADLAMGPSLTWTKESLKTYRGELQKLSNYYIIHQELIPFSMLRLNVTSIGVQKSYSKTCSCGENMVCVDWTGKTYACHLFSPIAISTDKALRGNILYNFSNHSQFCSAECKKCVLNNICNHCYGMNYLCTGDVLKHSPFHCRAFKIMYASNCKFRLKMAEYNNDNDSIKKIYNAIRKIS